MGPLDYLRCELMEEDVVLSSTTRTGATSYWYQAAVCSVMLVDASRLFKKYSPTAGMSDHKIALAFTWLG
jgi:hypothetical protein